MRALLFACCLFASMGFEAKAYDLFGRSYSLICPGSVYALVLQDGPGVLKVLGKSCRATHGGTTLGEWCQRGGDIYVLEGGRFLRYRQSASDIGDGCGLDPICFCGKGETS